MLGVTDLPAYLVGLFLIILLPGPNTLYVLSVAARKGVRPAYAAAAGVWTGDGILMVLSAAGVASLLKANDAIFDVVKIAGAAYLVWLGYGMLRSAWKVWRTRQERPLDEAIELVSAQESARERPYRRALTVSLLNPKAILFFVSFFVQFVDPAYQHPVLSFLLLGSLCTTMSALYLSGVIFSGVRLADAFRRRRRLTAGASAGTGALFLAFAAKLGAS